MILQNTPYNIFCPVGITNLYGFQRDHLSCGVDGSVQNWRVDDGSGRQRWLLQSAPQATVNIVVAGGTSGGRRFLSCSDAGTVDLWDKDDGSGRQRWVLNRVQGAGAKPDYVTISPAAGVTGLRFLSCSSDGTVVDLFGRDDGSGRQRWQFIAPGSQSSGRHFYPLTVHNRTNYDVQFSVHWNGGESPRFDWVGGDGIADLPFSNFPPPGTECWLEALWVGKTLGSPNDFLHKRSVDNFTIQTPPSPVAYDFNRSDASHTELFFSRTR